MDEQNNGAQPATNGEDTSPAAGLISQYVKDLSFENPNAPQSLAPQQQGPSINIQVNVNAKQLAESDFEVDLSLEGNAKTGNSTRDCFTEVNASTCFCDQSQYDSLLRRSYRGLVRSA